MFALVEYTSVCIYLGQNSFNILQDQHHEASRGAGAQLCDSKRDWF